MKLHETCSSRIYGFLRKSLPVDAAEDLTQETFLRLLQHKNLERKSITISYLFRVAQNLLRRRYNVAARARLIQETILKRQAAQLIHRVRESPPSAFESGPLHDALAELSPQEQTTIRLIVCEGHSYSQAANALNVPISTINNWKHRALNKLRGIIDAADDTDSELDRPQHQPTSGTAGSGEGRKQTPDTCQVDAPNQAMGSLRTDRLRLQRGTRVAG